MKYHYSIEFMKKCKYPNLVAEIAATGYSFCTLSEHMGHGPREQDDPLIMGKIFLGTKILYASEALALSRLFGRCSLDYLLSSELTLVELPAGNLSANEEVKFVTAAAARQAKDSTRRAAQKQKAPL